MLPEIVALDLPASAVRRTDVDLTVTVSDIERPDVQLVAVSWGDGAFDSDLLTAPHDNPRDLAFTHRYLRRGTYTATISMVDTGGGFAVRTAGIVIVKRPPRLPR